MSVGAFSLDQLMELAGLSVSQAGELSQLLGVTIHGKFNDVPSISGASS